MNDSLVRCGHCLETREVDFAAALSGGWPTCCSETMRLERPPPDVAAATRRALAGLSFVRADRLHQVLDELRRHVDDEDHVDDVAERGEAP